MKVWKWRKDWHRPSSKDQAGAERETRVLKNHELAWQERDHALFVGYAPSNNPRYAVTVVVEHGGDASKVAAPIARDLLLATQKQVHSSIKNPPDNFPDTKASRFNAYEPIFLFSAIGPQSENSPNQLGFDPYRGSGCNDWSCYVLYSAADGSWDPWAARPTTRFSVGLVILVTIALVDLRFWWRYAYLLLPFF